MNRTDKEVKNIDNIINIIKKCDIIRIGLFDNEYPYIIPLNFGYYYDKNKSELELYFHGANTGKKLDIIKNNKKAGFEMDCSTELIKGSNPCRYTMKFESVCGNGKISILSEEEKLKGLKYIMKQYSSNNFSNADFKSKVVEKTIVFKLSVNEITGKSSIKK